MTATRSSSDKYMSMKNVHQPVKDKKCEDCHLRHGIIPALILKINGNDLCLKCHTKEKIGLNKPNVHGALKTGLCTQCHNPHASNSPNLLQAEGNEACYQCHKRESFERKFVHKVLTTGGCRACHMAHSSDFKNLLTAADPKLCLGCHKSTDDALQEGARRISHGIQSLHVLPRPAFFGPAEAG